MCKVAMWCKDVWFFFFFLSFVFEALWIVTADIGSFGNRGGTQAGISFFNLIFIFLFEGRHVYVGRYRVGAGREGAVLPPGTSSRLPPLRRENVPPPPYLDSPGALQSRSGPVTDIFVMDLCLSKLPFALHTYDSSAKYWHN